MQVGDLVYIKPKPSHLEDEDFIALVLNKQKVGRSKLDSTILYDVLMAETNEVITVSDIYFTIWRIE